MAMMCPDDCDTILTDEVYRAYWAAFRSDEVAPFHRLVSTLTAQVRISEKRAVHFKNAFAEAYGFEPYHLVDAVRHQQEFHSTATHNRRVR